MKRILWLSALIVMPAMAELPPPSPAEKAQIEKKAAAEAAMLKRQELALARVQERVARQYRGSAPAGVQEAVGKSDVPKSATQPLGTPAKPHTPSEHMPQAEAHSRSSD